MTDQGNENNGRVESQPTTAYSLANDALDQLECSREHSRWLSALGKAIRDDLTTGRGTIAKDLASLAQYLADDQWNVLDNYIERANVQLNDLGQRS